mmetsp:Transcript_65263/g.105752  ORF Transcript_65263/g.105752 Transcript_65263/m.105752 type:complete len:85 (-) Transcript_65263:289-543(-)
MSYIPDFSKKIIEGRSGDDLQEKKKGDETQRENEKYPTQSTFCHCQPNSCSRTLGTSPSAKQALAQSPSSLWMCPTPTAQSDDR